MKKSSLTFATFSSLCSKKSSPKFVAFFPLCSKKGLACLLLILLVLVSVPFVFADNGLENGEDVDNDLEEVNDEDVETPDLDRVSETLAKDREIPEELRLVSRILFGVDETISISFFIILLMLWLIVLLVLKEIMEFLPFFKGATSWIGALIINLIFGVTGVFIEITTFYATLFDFGFFARLPLAGQVLAIVVLIVVGLGVFHVLNRVKSKVARDVSEQKGFKAGADMATWRLYLKNMLGMKSRS